MNSRPGDARAPSLVAQAYDEIKDAILTSRLAPGQLVNGPELAAAYGMSRTPVREALGLLTKEGFVTAVPRVGYLVSSVTVEDVKEIFELRFELEGVAAEWAATRAGEAELDRFHQVNTEVQALAQGLPAGEPSTIRLACATNRRFHLMVAGASGNRRLAELIDRLLQEGERVQSLDPHLRTVGFLNGAHVSVLDSLRRRDPSGARQAMEDHVRETQERVLRSALSLPGRSTKGPSGVKG